MPEVNDLAHKTNALRQDIGAENDCAVTEVDALLAVAVALSELREEVHLVGKTMLYVTDRLAR